MRLGVASLSSIESRLAKLEETQKFKFVKNIEIRDNFSFDIFDENGEVIRTYVPSPTGRKFHASDDFVRGMMGPFGSGKSVTCAADVVMRACKMPKCIDGIRRCKAVFMRNTSGELETSTVVTWLTWFSELGTIHQNKKPIYRLVHTFNDGDGQIELEVVFLACDREDDVKKLKSTEFTLAYLNEANELPSGLLDVIKGRVNGRYPSKVVCPSQYFTGVIFDTNPPAESHWMFKTFEVTQPDSYILFKQPSGLLEDERGNPVKDDRGRYLPNINADNMQNLRPDYYTKMAEGAPEEFVKVYCMGKYGLILTGKPVYPQYNDDLHAVNNIELVKDEAIFLGIDFGLTPACLLSQIIGGQLRAIKEFTSDFGTSVRELFEVHVIPYLQRYCVGMPLFSYHDPADPSGQATGISPSQALEEIGIASTPSVTNLLQPRLDSVKFFLNRMVGGKPAFILSKQGCPVLREGFFGRYKYQNVQSFGETRPREIPNKVHPHSDIHDALQYVALASYQGENEISIDSSLFLAPVRAQGGLF